MPAPSVPRYTTRSQRFGAMQHEIDLLGGLGLTETAEAARRQYQQKALDKADTAYVSLAFLRSSRILASVLSLLLAFRQSDILLTLEDFRQNKARSDEAAPAPAGPPRLTLSSQCDKNTGGGIVRDDVRPRNNSHRLVLNLVPLQLTAIRFRFLSVGLESLESWSRTLKQSSEIVIISKASQQCREISYPNIIL